MDSTMQSPPLLISSILTYGATIHADQEVVTCTEDEPRRMTYA
jgi:fatty-acyl-CoA synthase